MQCKGRDIERLQKHNGQRSQVCFDGLDVAAADENHIKWGVNRAIVIDMLVANRPPFGCFSRRRILVYSYDRIIQLDRGQSSQAGSAERNGIGTTICRSYFLVPISICSSLR